MDDPEGSHTVLDLCDSESSFIIKLFRDYFTENYLKKWLLNEDVSFLLTPCQMLLSCKLPHKNLTILSFPNLFSNLNFQSNLKTMKKSKKILADPSEPVMPFENCMRKTTPPPSTEIRAFDMKWFILVISYYFSSICYAIWLFRILVRSIILCV